jgi:tetratricopeptide (TPR) repeat protein
VSSTRGTKAEVATIAELEDARGWSPIRKHLGVRAFGVNAWTAREAGATVIPQHGEVPSGHEELYVVIAGHATFAVEDEKIDAPFGTMVFVCDPAVSRGAVAREPGTTVLTVGGKPGEAFRPRAWETNSEVFALLDSGRNEEAKRVLLEALDRYDDRGTLLYNLACAEAQLGENDAALEHLRTALVERPGFSEDMRTDSDLEPLRSDPRFDEIVGAAP